MLACLAGVVGLLGSWRVAWLVGSSWVGMLAHWLGGGLDGRLVGTLVSWLGDWFVDWLSGWLACRLFPQLTMAVGGRTGVVTVSLVSWLVGGLVGWLLNVLVGFLAGCFDDWRVGLRFGGCPAQ